MSGKGMTPRKGYNQAKYAANYDSIFRAAKQPTQPAKEPMNTQDNPSPLPTVLPWHREAAKEAYNHIGDWAYESGVEPIAAIIARHDVGRTDSPALRLEKNKHAETLRLLELILRGLESGAVKAKPFIVRDPDAEQWPTVYLEDEIRAHLAAMKGTP